MTDTIKMMFRDLTMSIRASEEDDRVLIFRGTTESVASDGGILRAKGMDHKTRYKGNPVVLWNHGEEVLGNTIKLEYDADARAWDFHIRFLTAEESEFADRKFRMAKAKALRAASVGFKIEEMEDLTDKKREELGIGRFGWVAKRWTLHELSLVPVGADPMALQRSIEAGEFSQEDVDAEPPRNRKQTPEPIEPVTDPGSSTKDTRSITALEENTRAHQRTQAVMASLVDEIAGLRIDIAESGTGPESPHVPVAAPDDRSKEREQEERELKQRLDAFIAKYGDSK